MSTHQNKREMHLVFCIWERRKNHTTSTSTERLGKGKSDSAYVLEVARNREIKIDLTVSTVSVKPRWVVGMHLVSTVPLRALLVHFFLIGYIHLLYAL